MLIMGVYRIFELSRVYPILDQEIDTSYKFRVEVYDGPLGTGSRPFVDLTKDSLEGLVKELSMPPHVQKRKRVFIHDLDSRDVIRTIPISYTEEDPNGKGALLATADPLELVKFYNLLVRATRPAS